MYLKLLLITVILLAIAFAGIAIKMFIKKDGEFKKQCSTIDPQTGKNLGCTCQGSPSDGSCGNDEKEHKHISPSLAQIKEFQTD
ncbi:MAG: membrane or secreted protein [Bacteroidetes bacterium]|nr:membrane or secreted protein [Bacteroidota bacterium]MBL6944551.1 membrane or secreted protein [Bacteroidales bacterium]